MEEPSKFSVSQTAHSLTWSIMENPHAGLDDCHALEKGCLAWYVQGSASNVSSRRRRSARVASFGQRAATARALGLVCRRVGDIYIYITLVQATKARWL